MSGMSPPRSGRHDQPEMMPVLRPLDGLLLGVHPLARGVIEHAMLAVGAGAFPSQVGDMARQTSPRLAGLVPADVRLDDHPLAHSPARGTARQVLSRAPFEAAQPPGELAVDAPLFAATSSHPANLVRINAVRLSPESSSAYPPPLFQKPLKSRKVKATSPIERIRCGNPS